MAKPHDGLDCGYGKSIEIQALDGQLTNDEFFVTDSAAKQGVVIKNKSLDDDIVILKHFAHNPDLAI